MNTSTPNQDIFYYYAPKKEYIGLLSIPHSGEILPQEFKKYLVDDPQAIMQDVDFRVHELIDIQELQNAGVAVIKSNIIRTAIDLNRSHDKTLLNWKKNSKGIQVVNQEAEAQMAKEDKEKLIALYYTPYYQMLKSLIEELQVKKETPSVIDLHSMPSRATEYHLKITPNQKIKRPDFCVSDIKGLSAKKEFIDYTCNQLRSGFKDVTQNDPYFGGHITRHLQEKFPHINNIQIEISREIYMDETSQKLIDEKVNYLKPILTKALINTFKKFS